ncbi:MAG TPA: AAA family ATPase, partial [Nitrososphaerales archaeon]
MSDGELMAAAIRTFLFVDIRGYTRFTVEHGDAEALQLVEKFGILARRAFAAWHGEMAGSAGDELIAVFGSAREAIVAAIQLQASFAEEAKSNPMLPQVGIGLDAGEAVPAGDTYIGAALNLAARLCKLAGPQEVLASESVIHIAGKLEGLKYVERGFTQLKGFQDPVHIFQVVDTRQVSHGKSESEQSTREPIIAPLPIGAYLGALPPTVLVARSQELGRVMAAADSVVTGNGRLILISGEAGVGKTRLAQEAMLTVRNRRFLVAVGRCYEQQKTVPFYPFVDVLSSLYNSSPTPIRAAVVGRWPYLYRLLPELGPESIPASAGSPEEIQRLFRAVEGFLQAITSGIPVAIFLDDLHCADQPSIDLMQHLARTSRASRLLMVGTYRDAEIGPRHPLEAALRDLTREELVEKIKLSRLGSDETSKLIAATLGDRSAPTELVKVIQERAEGNPFFTQQLVRFLVERGDLRQADGRWTRSSVVEAAIPDSVRSVIRQRMARLGEGTQELLKEASVLGQTFRFGILERFSGRKEVEIESCLEEASFLGLVTET